MQRLIILLAIVGAAFAVPRDPQRIVGGNATTIDQYPYMSNMQFFYWGIIWSQACGGSLITSQTIVSAAHCYDGDQPQQWRVRLGSSYATGNGTGNSTFPGTIHPVSQLIIHERYNSSTITNDVAIVRLAIPATLGSPFIGIARIAGPNYNLADGTAVTAIGWGALSPGGASPEQLQHVVVNIINQNLCAERYAYLKTQPGFQNWPDITPDMLCAGILNVGGRDACQGDSGGPLAHVGDILVGITSWGYSCAHEFYPGVNARVSYFSDWIVANGST